jgi:hypothetical protein
MRYAQNAQNKQNARLPGREQIALNAHSGLYAKIERNSDAGHIAA